ncbi:MAG: hypothetical protein EHM21_02830, partial [Chloroflexi bacterium]
MNQKHKRFYIVLALFTILSLTGGACQLFSRAAPALVKTEATQTAEAAAISSAVETALAAQPTSEQPAQLEAGPTNPPQRPEKVVGAVPAFAVFKEPPANKQAALQPYTVEADLSNVVNPFLLSKAQLERLATDGFIVTPG